MAISIFSKNITTFHPKKNPCCFMLLKFGFNNLCPNYGDFNFFSKNIATFHPQKTLVVLCYSKFGFPPKWMLFPKSPIQAGNL
jgi:hypothetical protein